MAKDKFDGYRPRHKGVIEEVFCGKGCLVVDQILVPFPDCRSHGGAFDKDSKCVTIEVRPAKS